LRTLEVYGNTHRGNQRRCGKFVLYYLVTHFLVRKYKLLNQVGRLFQYCRLKYSPSCLLACVDRSFLSRRFGILHYYDPDHRPTTPQPRPPVAAKQQRAGAAGRRAPASRASQHKRLKSTAVVRCISRCRRCAAPAQRLFPSLCAIISALQEIR
jgi:hypothetical protein